MLQFRSIFLIIFLYAGLISEIYAGVNTLPLKNIQNVDVLLFELDPPANLTISAFNGDVNVSGNRSFLQEEDKPAFAISVSGSAIQVRSAQGIFQTPSLKLEADDTGLIRIYHPRLGIRYYRGTIIITVRNNRLRLINTVFLEDYIGSVVGGEMNFPEMEALKVQAVIARTYALWSIAQNRNPEYQLTDHTLNQVYNGILIQRPDYLEAALSTSGEIITWSGKLILAAYSSTCGGTTSDNESIWSGGPLTYLRSVNDGDACSASPHFRWKYEVQKSELYPVLRSQTRRHINGIRIKEKDRHGLVLALELSISGGDSQEIRANAFRLLVNQQIERNSIKSTRLKLTETENSYIFEGKGLGHGIGLCQWGARGLAQSGWNYRDILKLYYSGTEIIDFHTIDTETIELAQ